MHRLRTFLPFAALACAVLVCIALSVVLTTGFDSGTKRTQLLLRLVLITPPLVWVLRHRGETNNAPLKKIPFAACLLIFIAIVIPISWYLRDGVYSGDESAYRFQARIMRSFHAYAQAPPAEVLPEFDFQNEVRFQGRWFGKYPPGWPALLAALGCLLPDWLVCPALGLLLLWLVYKISCRLYDERTASIAVALMACSPFCLFLSVGYLSHIACAIFVALATLALLMALETGRTRDFALTFAAVGAAFLVRPFTAACLGLVLASILVWNVRQGRIKLYKILLGGVPTALMALSLLLYDNAVLTGHFWRSPYALAGGSDVPPELAATVPSIVRHAFVFTPVSLARMELHSIPFVLALALYGLIQERSKRTLLLAMALLSLIVGHIFFTDTSSDSFVGERYYFEAYFAMVILAAIGWQRLRDSWKVSQVSIRAAMLSVVCLTIYNYVYLAQGAIEYRQGYARIYETAEHLTGERLLVFMHNGQFFDASHFNPNSPRWQDARLLFALDPGKDSGRAFAARILHRPVWFVMTYNPQAKSATVEQEHNIGGTSE